MIPDQTGPKIRVTRKSPGLYFCHPNLLARAKGFGVAHIQAPTAGAAYAQYLQARPDRRHRHA